jgi:cytochrome c553
MNTGPSPQAQAFGLRQRARWHREQSEDYLNHSAAAMRQHEQAAEAMENQADKLEQEPEQ